MNADCLLERVPSGAPVDTLAHRDLTDSILKVFYEVYNELGYGFLESVDPTALTVALTDRGLDVGREVPLGDFGGAVSGASAQM